MFRPKANTQAMRLGAQQFSMAAVDLHQKSLRIQTLASELTKGYRGWHGEGADAFQGVAQNVMLDVQVAADAWNQASSVLHTLAGQYDEVNELQRQLYNIEIEIQHVQQQLQWADDSQRGALHSRLQELHWQHSNVSYQSDAMERMANQQASQRFYEIAQMTHRLQFDPEQSFVGHGDTLLGEIGGFFQDLWHQAKKFFGDVKQEVEEDIEDLKEELTGAFASIKEETEVIENMIKESKDAGGVLGGFVGFAEGFGKSIADLLKGAWEMSPAGMLVDAIENPDALKRKVQETFLEWEHPVDAIKKKWDNFHPIETGQVLFNSVVDSFDRDIVNGNSYTRSKWFGYAAGLVATALATDGVGLEAEAGVATEAGVAGAESVTRTTEIGQLLGQADHVDETVAGIKAAGLSEWSTADLNELLRQINGLEIPNSRKATFISETIREAGFTNFDWNETRNDVLAWTDMKIEIEELSEPTTLYRRGNPGEPESKYGLGKWWADEPRDIQRTRDELAVLEVWGSKLDTEYKVTVPAGVRVLKGTAAPQKAIQKGATEIIESRPGGGVQYWLNHVDNLWLDK